MTGDRGKGLRHGSLILFFCLATFAGCGYPEVSPKAYEISKAMYRLCNQREDTRIELIARLIEESLESGDISAAEAKLLQEILEEASEGHWDDCAAEVRRLMNDQVRR
jgi:hypothetical protein